MPNKVIFFSSQTCAPCKQLKPEFLMQSEKRGFGLEFVDMTRENQELFLKYDVRTVPTVICVDQNNECVGRMTGAASRSVIEAHLDEWGL